MSQQFLFHADGSMVMGSGSWDRPAPIFKHLPGIGINTASTLNDLIGPVVRHGQWISRQGLPCASDDLTEHEAQRMCIVRPHRSRVPKVMRANKYYAEY